MLDVNKICQSTAQTQNACLGHVYVENKFILHLKCKIKLYLVRELEAIVFFSPSLLQQFFKSNQFFNLNQLLFPNPLETVSILPAEEISASLKRERWN